MNSPFRIGIVGCGKIARRHVEACLLSSSVEIAALVDPAAERTESLAAEFGVETEMASSLDEVIDRLDGVIIAAPNNFHCKLAVQCARAGVHVLIEKPIAGSSEESIEICQAHEGAGTVCAVGFVTRFRDNNHQMHRLIQSGYFGTIYEFAYQFGSRGGWAPYSAYNLDKQATGGGVLVVTGSHFLDRMLHWFGDPADCRLWSDSVGGPEANALAAFRFGDSDATIHGTARFSKTVALPAGFVMKTSKGTVMLADSPTAKINFLPHDEHLLLTVEPDQQTGNIFHAQIEDFVGACRTASLPAVDGREGLRSVQLTETLYQNCSPLADAPASGRIEPNVSSPELSMEAQS